MPRGVPLMPVEVYGTIPKKIAVVRDRFLRLVVRWQQGFKLTAGRMAGVVDAIHGAQDQADFRPGMLRAELLEDQGGQLGRLIAGE